MFCGSETVSTVPINVEINDVNQGRFNISVSTYEVPFLILLACLSFNILSIIVKVWNRLSQLFWDQFTVSVEVSGAVVNANAEDMVYYELLTWLSKTYPDLPSRTKMCTYGRSTIDMYGNISDTKRPIISPPVFGTYYIKYENHWIRLERKREDSVRSMSSSCETIILTAWAGQQAILDDIIHGAMKRGDVKVEEKVYTFRIDHGEWYDSGPGRDRRPPESVILDDGISERIFTDVHDFIDRKEWYNRRDIPHRRGYLLFGPPGCGKTSLVKALAGGLHYNICVLSLSAKDLTDDDLASLLESAPLESIILMEDIDAAFKSREDTDATTAETNLAFEGRTPNSVTFRGLLNALDGVTSSDDGRIICMTTNYVEKLDPALIRCGRVDQKIFIGYPSDKQLRRLFERFYDEALEEQTIQFIRCIRDLKRNVSIAMIQGLFIIYKDSAEDAVKYSKKYFEEELAVGAGNKFGPATFGQVTELEPTSNGDGELTAMTSTAASSTGSKSEV